MKRGRSWITLLVAVAIIIIIAGLALHFSSNLRLEKFNGVVSEGESDKILDSSPESESLKCKREFSPKYSNSSYYTGALFDAHFHIPVTFDHSSIEQSTTGHIINNPSTNHKDPMLGKDFIIDEILCFFDKEDVKGSIGFFIPNPGDLDESIQEAKEIKTKSSGKINLFLMPGLLDAQILDNIQKSNPNLFRGYGELAFYSPEMSGYTPSSDKFMEIYNIADKHDLIVMIHPGQNQKSDVEKAVKNNPGVKFLLHGFEIENDITYLMDKYPNVYFSLDSATMYSMQGLFINGPKEEFVSRFKNDFNMLLERNVKKWKPAIKKHPDRFMWGTDKGDSWHFSEDISLLMEEFARAFIGRLDEEVQEKYAYQNAEKLLA